MKFELTKEQVEFISELCAGVYWNYDGYSREEQMDRELMASDIQFALDSPIEEDVQEN